MRPSRQAQLHPNRDVASSFLDTRSFSDEGNIASLMTEAVVAYTRRFAVYPDYAQQVTSRPAVLVSYATASRCSAVILAQATTASTQLLIVLATLRRAHRRSSDLATGTRVHCRSPSIDSNIRQVESDDAKRSEAR